MAKSTKTQAAQKPAKPYPEFPLFAHNSGRWAKKINGKLHYFGRWGRKQGGKLARVAGDGWKEALATFEEQVDDLQAGRTPRQKAGELTVANACDHFLAWKEESLEAGELAQRTFDRYLATCKYLAKHLGRNLTVESLRPDDFQRLRARMAKQWGPVALGNEIQMVRSVFRYAYEAELIEKPVRFGPGFKKPTAKTIRKKRSAKGPRMFTPEQFNALLEHATPNMRAMLLLGLNGGLGNTDLAALPLTALDLESGWLNYAREKTGIERRIPLWPETVDAVRQVIRERGEPDDPEQAGLLFVGKRGKSYMGSRKGYRVTQEFDRVAKWAGVEGRTFYDARRTFQTIGEGANDLAAVQAIMGHAASNSDMSAVYRQSVSDDRLRAVTEHVRAWLTGGDQPPRTESAGRPTLRVVG